MSLTVIQILMDMSVRPIALVTCQLKKCRMSKGFHVFTDIRLRDFSMIRASTDMWRMIKIARKIEQLPQSLFCLCWPYNAYQLIVNIKLLIKTDSIFCLSTQQHPETQSRIIDAPRIMQFTILALQTTFDMLNSMVICCHFF